MMREIYMNENANSIRDIPLATTDGIKLIAVRNQRKDTSYLVKPWSEKDAIEALQKGNR